MSTDAPRPVLVAIVSTPLDLATGYWNAYLKYMQEVEASWAAWIKEHTWHPAEDELAEEVQLGKQRIAEEAEKERRDAERYAA